MDDLDFADDPVHLSHIQHQMKGKIGSIAAASSEVGLNIHKEKNKVIKYETESTIQVTIDVVSLKVVEAVTYLGSIVDKQGGSDAGVKSQISHTMAE